MPHLHSNHREMRRRVATLVALSLFLSLTVLPSTHASAHHSSCFGTGTVTKLNNIHWGTVSGATTAKVLGQMSCTQQVDKIVIDLWLWYCGNQDSRGRSKAWLNSNCDRRFSEQNWLTPTPGQTYKWSVPQPGQARFLANGWYAAELIAYAYDRHSDGITYIRGDQFWKYANCVYPSCQNYG
jgi:hypothetical protein